MKKQKHIIWGILAFQIALVIFIICTSSVSDMTLARGKVISFDKGWKLNREDGSVISVDRLPYLAESDPYENLVMTNTISEELSGKTLYFLSADKRLRILINSEEIYSFGWEDDTVFGHTPGSVMVFADIPEDAAGKEIRIVMQSSYANYASYISKMKVADREVAILNQFVEKKLDIGCSISIMSLGIIILILAIFRKMTSHRGDGMEYLAIYFLMIGCYHMVETKILGIFYGNQFLYSNLVFLILMTAPLFLMLYIYENIPKLQNSMRVLTGLSFVNIAIQLFLQLSNTVDFLSMAFLSHGILAMISIVLVAYSAMEVRKREGNGELIRVVGVAAMVLGAAIDMIRTYIEKIGDLGKYSRYGVVVFAVCEVTIMVRKMSMEQLQFAEQARDEANAANRAKSQFLANMSHEIRTPINGVLGMNAMILKEAKDSEIREYAKNIQSAGQTLINIVNDILDISKIEAHKLELIPCEYDLFEVFNDCYHLNMGRMEEKGLRFIHDIDQNIPCHLYGDDVRVRQVINNLLSNAAKYTHEGSVTLRMGYSWKTEKEIVLRIEVHDTGIGIKEEDLEKLFTSFTRVEQKRNRNIEGTGLGLALTQNLVRMMDGELHVDSVYGEGSVFYVTIVQKVVDTEPIGDVKLRYQDYIRREDEVEDLLWAPQAHILLVDDVELNLKVVKGLLKDTGIRIDTALNGMQALEAIRSIHYDVIFLDHMMPEMDGIEVRKHMSESKEGPNQTTPVIMLTANAIIGAKSEYLAAGFQDYLTKPVKEKEIKDILRQYLKEELLQEKPQGEENIPEAGTQEADRQKEESAPETKLQEVKTEQAQGMGGFPRLLQISDIDTETGLGYCMDQEFYVDMIHEYVNSDKKQMLLDYFAADDWKNYEITVHALKSTSLTIGAVALSEEAKALEFACKEGNYDYVKANHAGVMERYAQLLVELAEV